MTKITFEKYQGTGNDFIILENTLLSTEQIQMLCDRKFGIGADGVIIMNRASSLDFDMMYYNADGSESFCGNGSRCSVMYAKNHHWIGNSCKFNSNDGEHEAEIVGEQVNLKMHDVYDYHRGENNYVINTGSPHFLRFCSDIKSIDIISDARKIRYSEEYKQAGINVNYLKNDSSTLYIRTYERGVEDETLSCGTGVTAAAIANYIELGLNDDQFVQQVSTEGGMLEVRFKHTGNGFTNVYLCGPAVFVFKGEIEF